MRVTNQALLLVAIEIWAKISVSFSFALMINSRPLSSLFSEAMDSDMGDVHIPSTGISVSDEMEAAQQDLFVTEVVPIEGLSGVAQLITTATQRGSFEPVRYLAALSPPEYDANGDSAAFRGATFALVDVPPFSSQLATRLKAFMGVNHTLLAILITNRDAIHYDEAPGVFVARRSDLEDWKRAFPGIRVVAYRLDIPRDCRQSVTHILDGQGPFALELEGGNFSFVETGRPLTIDEWDSDTAAAVLGGELAPDDETNFSESEYFSPEAIRAREDGKPILAIHTPGHSFGSLSFVFPNARICCSGYTIPVEDNRMDENEGTGIGGPTLDVRGYITTSKAGIHRQMDSARKLADSYSDRFDTVLPSRGDPLFLEGKTEEKKKLIENILDQYDRIGQIYEELGIIRSEASDI